MDRGKSDGEKTPLKRYLNELPKPVRIVFYLLTAVMAGMGLYSLVKGWIE